MLLAELAEQPVAEWTGADVIRALSLERAAEDEQARIDRAVRLSWIVPGLGHQAIGHHGSAGAFIAADLAVTITTVTTAIMLLPVAVRTSNLPYLTSSFSEIDAAWDSITPAEMIPSLATLIIGAGISLTLRSAAAHDAAEVYRQELLSDWPGLLPEEAGGE
jgi:hypothetical protein